MNIIRRMLDRRKVWKALPDYPVYAPPVRYGDAVPSRGQIEQNYEYFLQQKADRIKHLAGYLAPFAVELRLDPDALPALDSWLYRYSGHLLPEIVGSVDAIYGYDPAWNGKWHGLNIINDIAIFAGDYVVSRNKNAHWGAWYGENPASDYEKDGFGQPCIFGLREPRSSIIHFPIITEIFMCSEAGRFRLVHGAILAGLRRWDRPGELVRLLGELSNRKPPSGFEAMATRQFSASRSP